MRRILRINWALAVKEMVSLGPHRRSILLSDGEYSEIRIQKKLHRGHPKKVCETPKQR